ncbi:DsbA family oxidoreductase [Dyella telluris]|uniref:DsbA family oxidoreductase n=1 Tax=Dyella telluris TaxID=2763498 RepID=A0A7G8Q3N1_9GAMM|nr:DsbA family oxidoreductase [Dyella telluris]QNK01389.1 DsbA family oxidoreductase [Dyella telluris]
MTVTETPVRKRVQAEFYFDLICPWCMIGKRQLEQAIDLLVAAYPDTVVDVQWKSLPLMPDMPPEGKPFQAFYRQRLGSAQAVESRRSQIREVGDTYGIQFQFDRIEWMPNTIAAHRLVWQAGEMGGPALQSHVIDELFHAYFLRGVHIGEPRALADIAEIYGMSPAASICSSVLPSYDATLEYWRGEAKRKRLSGVPAFVFGDRYSQAGAMDPETLARAMLGSVSA